MNDETRPNLEPIEKMVDELGVGAELRSPSGSHLLLLTLAVRLPRTVAGHASKTCSGLDSSLRPLRPLLYAQHHLALHHEVRDIYHEGVEKSPQRARVCI